MSSSAVPGFIGVRSGVRRFHPGLLGSLGCALGIVRFIRGRWVHRGAPWWSSGSSGVAEFIGVDGFIGVLSWVRQVPPGSCTGFIRVRPVGRRFLPALIGVRPGGRWVHPVSLNSLGFHSGSLSSLGYAVGSCGSAGVAELIWVCPNGR